MNADQDFMKEFTKRSGTEAIYRVVTFHKDLYGRDIMQIFLTTPIAKRPYFAARIGKETVIRFLERAKISHENKNDFLLIEDHEYNLRKLIIFAGVHQFLPSSFGEYEETRLMELIKNLTMDEIHFWSNRFVSAYEDGYFARRRVARAFRVLYGF
jgi:hypothetical protein